MEFSDALKRLERLSPTKLDQTSRRIRGDLGAAEWKMGLCLLAWSRGRAFRKLGFATVSEYAERVLNLSGRKIGALLGAARALEHLPLLSQAFRRGEICWGKIRAIHGLATPETEAEWLAFARAHRTDEVARKVTMSPTEWKHHRALKASLKGKPVASKAQVSAVLKTSERVTALKASTPSSPASPSGPTEPATTQRPLPPTGPRTVRLVVELTPDQYALYERAQNRARVQAGRHLSRAEVVVAMAESLLNQGTARSRAKHQVVIHTVEGTEKGWYDTDRGILPVSPEVLRTARQSGTVQHDDSQNVNRNPHSKPGCSRNRNSKPGYSCNPKPGPSRNNPIPNPNPNPNPSKLIHPHSKDHTRDLSGGPDHAPDPPRTTTPQNISRAYLPTSTVRALYARAAHRCERCRTSRGPLHIHHSVPVSEGGDHALQALKLLCSACHSLHHKTDFETKPRWRLAKETAIRTGGKGGSQSSRPTTNIPINLSG